MLWHASCVFLSPQRTETFCDFFYLYRVALLMVKSVITTWKRVIVIVIISALSLSASAAEPPRAGDQIRQIPPSPIMQKTVPETPVKQEQRLTVPVPDQTVILVKSLHITGQTQYSEAKLVAITGFRPASELTLSELRGMALKIADLYHKDGYFVAQAYLPAQDISNETVTINVIEGHYGDITLHNQTNLSDNLAHSLISGLTTGGLIDSVPLERRLLLLSDLPGVAVKSTLIPGSSIGSSDLIVDITPGERVTGSVDADNAGNRYTGAYRLGATVNLNDSMGLGDVATVRTLLSNAGLYYIRASYQLQTGSATVGAAYSILGYHLGEEFKSLHANGTAQIMSIYGNYPLIRSRDTNLHIQLAFDDKTFQDRVDSTSTVTDKTARLLMISLYGDHRDNFYGGGQSGYSLTWTTGSIAIQTPAAYSYDAATAQSSGQYNKLGYSAMRLQNITESISLYATINGQLALKNLDVSEKMELGGMYAVRAYPEGEVYADQGFVLNLEARLLLPTFSERLPGQIHLIGFADTGTVTINKKPWSSEPNHKTLNGAGLGITWEEYNNFAMRAYYAHKLGSGPATSAPDSPGRFWVQLVKYF